MQRYYYAMTDSFTGDNPREYTSGFANTKEPVAFASKKERAVWLSETKLLIAKAISRKEAGRIAYSIYEEKGCRVYGTNEYVVLVPSRW